MNKNDFLFEDLDLFFQNLLQPKSGLTPLTANTKLSYPADVYSEEGVGCVIEIPIVDGSIDDISVFRAGDEITVAYHRPNVETANRKYQQRQIVKRDFEFLWRIGNKFDVSLLTTSYNDGLLRLTIPWAKSALPEKVTIETVKQLQGQGN